MVPGTHPTLFLPPIDRPLPRLHFVGAFDDCLHVIQSFLRTLRPRRPLKTLTWPGAPLTEVTYPSQRLIRDTFPTAAHPRFLFPRPCFPGTDGLTLAFTWSGGRRPFDLFFLLAILSFFSSLVGGYLPFGPRPPLGSAFPPPSFMTVKSFRSHHFT